MIISSYNSNDSIIYIERTEEIKIQELLELVNNIFQNYHEIRHAILEDIPSDSKLVYYENGQKNK